MHQVLDALYEGTLFSILSFDECYPGNGPATSDLMTGGLVHIVRPLIGNMTYRVASRGMLTETSLAFAYPAQPRMSIIG